MNKQIENLNLSSISSFNGVLMVIVLNVNSKGHLLGLFVLKGLSNIWTCPLRDVVIVTCNKPMNDCTILHIFPSI